MTADRNTPAESAKNLYTTPEFKVFGTIADLTKASFGQPTDGAPEGSEGSEQP